MEHNYHMYYDNPAKRWGNALETDGWAQWFMERPIWSALH